MSLNIRAVNFDDFLAGIRASQPAVCYFVSIRHAHTLILVTGGTELTVTLRESLSPTLRAGSLQPRDWILRKWDVID